MKTVSVLTQGYGIKSRYYNHFLALFLAVFCIFFAQNAYAGMRILALGDSLTAGYGLLENESFPVKLETALKKRGHKDITVINAGVSGDTTAGGLSRVGWLMAENPDVVILTLGGNDGLRGLSPKQTRENLKQIILRFKKAKVPVLLAGMMAPPNLGRDYSEKFNGLYGDLAQTYRTLYYPFFLKDVAGKSVLNQSDGIHPNADGVDKIVSNILPYTEKLLTRAK
ncbi:arylesterase [Curvivirga aplysinae]|uniref:arylesterase n=1 Tax=Curvivirga aplysinae TaxID=2529852 RepID=UPI001F40AEA1|nr:arylesterase [Curvivirga aplysinae]